MIDLITPNRSLFIKGDSNFRTSIGGLFSFLFLVIVVFLLTYFMMSSSPSTFIEYELSDDELEAITPPKVKIVYGFHKNVSSNLQIVFHDGVSGNISIIPLNEYHDDEWNKYFNRSKNTNYAYFFHELPKAGFVEIVEIIPKKSSITFSN